MYIVYRVCLARHHEGGEGIFFLEGGGGRLLAIIEKWAFRIGHPQDTRTAFWLKALGEGVKV